jgi:serine/threonine protein kinase
MSERRRPSEQYRRLWTSEVPDLEKFVESLPQLTSDQLADIIEIDQSELWKRGERPKAESYLKRYPAIAKEVESALLVIYGEYYLRTELGENPSMTEYVNRFPKFAKRLRDQIQWHEALDSDPSREEPPVPPPVIAGFEILEKLGDGGVCSVYRVRQGDDEFALKILHERHKGNDEKLARLKREAEIGSELTHPNIVQVIGYGEAPPHLWMQHCSGGPLSTQIRRLPMKPTEAVRIAREIARGVEYAHGKGIIHRDLKPANVLLTASGVPKISDFGLAFSRQIPSTITSTGDIFGTPAYMSPEQTHSAEQADELSDIYSLGTILYECLTGRPPFLAPSAIEVIALIRDARPLRPREFNPKIPESVERLCLACLSKLPAGRPSTAADVANELR